MRKGASARAHRMTIVNAMLVFVIILVVIQLWLLTATLNAYLGGDRAIAIPGALASCACLAINLLMLRHLYRLER